MKGSPTAAAAKPPYDAVIFDLDGVVTPTATVHQLAWGDAYEQIVNDPRFTGDLPAPRFTSDDYISLLDGKPREAGLIDLLASRGVVIDLGAPTDATGNWTAYGLAALKNKAYLTRLKNDGIRPYPGTLQLLQSLQTAGVPSGGVTSSRNATPVLAAAGMADTFAVVVDGTVAAKMGLPGKPAPDVFLEAAHRLGVVPHRAVVIEDSMAGVESARSGGFGLVVGIDRQGTRRQLEAAGAHVVLNDVGELDLGLVMTDPWQLVYEGIAPEHEGHREALTTLGNGYMGVRGAVCEGGREARYAGMYLAGVYNRVAARICGEPVVEEHMVNSPDCLPLDLSLGDDGTWWSEGGLRVVRERRTLDMRQAILMRHVLLEAQDGRRLDFTETRLVSMSEPHLLALENTVTPQGWSGTVRVRAGVDAGTRNANLPEPAMGSRVHLRDRTAATAGEPGCDSMVEVETKQSQVRVAVAFHADVGGAGGLPESKGAFHFRTFKVHCLDGAPTTITRVAAVVTSRDRPVSSASSAASDVLARAGADFSVLRASHVAAWQRTLRPFLVEINAPTQVQLVLNLHLFHLLQTLTHHTAELDAGVPARGLHGEGYRGHVFWDELFVLPVLTARSPDVARALIDYRWRRLPAARQAATGLGLRGAMFPWQSGSDGRDETPHWLYNTRSGRWVPDYSGMQRHVGLAIALNVWDYYDATGDKPWFLQKGAELIVEVARFFSTMAEYDQDDQRFHLRGIVGPDEYHTRRPGATTPGLDDNAYTNVMAAWICERAVGIFGQLSGHEVDHLKGRLGVTVDDVSLWSQVAGKMYVPFHSDGVISQFRGYDSLEELDWEKYHQRYGNIERLDLILEAEGDDVNRYKLAKQADVLMLPYLLGTHGLKTFLNRLGYPVSEDQLNRTVEYYLARTAHGSTLSRVAHASVLASVDPDRAWDSFREALDADLDDTQHGTTKAGIHLGAMAGSIDVVQRSFAGLRMGPDGLSFSPCMPRGLGKVAFQLRYRGHLLKVQLLAGRIRISSATGDAAPISLRVEDQSVLLAPGESRSFRVAASEGRS